jgi:hypothetical protein
LFPSFTAALRGFAERIFIIGVFALCGAEATELLV